MTSPAVYRLPIPSARLIIRGTEDEPLQVLELFAGCGGAATGLHAAGMSHLTCLEGAKDAVATMRTAGLPGLHVSIPGITPYNSGTSKRPEYAPEYPWMPGWCGVVDLLWASPPCQPYSTAGKQLHEKDPRDGWPAVTYTVRATLPTWAIVENVPGVPAAEWVTDLRAAGYAHVAWRKLDAADYGVPQQRKRIFIVAGPKEFRWPAPTHSCRALAESKWITGEYWQRHGIAPAPYLLEGRTVDVPSATIRAQNAGPEITRKHPDVSPDAPAGSQRSGGSGHSAPPPWLASTSPATPTKEETRSLRSPPDGLLPWRTVRDVLPDLGGVFFDQERGAGMCERWGNPRRLTPAECAILQSFPPDYPFCGTKTSIYRQIGNAVPPPLADVMARALLASV